MIGRAYAVDAPAARLITNVAVSGTQLRRSRVRRRNRRRRLVGNRRRRRRAFDREDRRLRPSVGWLENRRDRHRDRRLAYRNPHREDDPASLMIPGPGEIVIAEIRRRAADRYLMIGRAYAGRRSRGAAERRTSPYCCPAPPRPHPSPQPSPSARRQSSPWPTCLRP